MLAGFPQVYQLLDLFMYFLTTESHVNTQARRKFQISSPPGASGDFPPVEGPIHNWWLDLFVLVSGKLKYVANGNCVSAY